MGAFQPEIRPALPRSLGHGIGIIGAGGIVQHGHLPGYRKADFNVVGLASRRAEAVERTCGEWGIAHGFTDWRRLLDMPEVEVVDVTYPFDEERLEIVREAAARGKHILMQKPMAHALAAAEEMVRVCEAHGVLLAVNQNARWCPQYRAARLAIAEGLLGTVHLLIHEMHNTQDAQPWFQQRWYARQPRFQLLEYAVHHLDLLRFWMGQEPVRVKASLARKPGQHATGEMIAAINLEFPGMALGIALENNAAWPATAPCSRFRIEGTQGMVDGEAVGNVHVHLQSALLDEGVHALELPGAWFPDGFIGTMGELLCAIEEGREPSISGRDNLRTLALIFAAYGSAENE